MSKSIEEIADSVERGVGALQTEQKATLQKVEDYQVKNKEALEKLTAEKNSVVETVNKQAGVITTLNEALAAVRAESRMGVSSPQQAIARFCANPTRALAFVSCFRKAAGMPISEEAQKAIDLHFKTAVAGDTTPGSNTVPQETSAMIYDTLLRYGAWNTLGVIPIGSRTQILPLVTARPLAYWVAQATAVTEGAMTGATVTLTIKEAIAWIPVARPLLDDSAADMAPYIMDLLAQAVAYRLDWACFSADGTADTTDGGYVGIASGGTAATAAAGNTTVASLDLEDFVRAMTTVDAEVLNRSPKWWMHPTVLAKICLIRDGNGRPMFQTALEAPSSTVGSILGFPVVVTNAMPSTDSTGQVIAVFGDPQAGAVGIRKGIELARSDEFQFSSNTSCFRAIIRAGFIIRAATAFAKLTLA